MELTKEYHQHILNVLADIISRRGDVTVEFTVKDDPEPPDDKKKDAS